MSCRTECAMDSSFFWCIPCNFSAKRLTRSSLSPDIRSKVSSMASTGAADTIILLVSVFHRPSYVYVFDAPAKRFLPALCSPCLTRPIFVGISNSITPNPFTYHETHVVQSRRLPRGHLQPGIMAFSQGPRTSPTPWASSAPRSPMPCKSSPNGDSSITNPIIRSH